MAFAPTKADLAVEGWLSLIEEALQSRDRVVEEVVVSVTHIHVQLAGELGGKLPPVRLELMAQVMRAPRCAQLVVDHAHARIPQCRG